MQFTPDFIDYLQPDDIFVFGSNLAGSHIGGAARIARKKFGAIPGVGVGLQGRSYAIPTMQGGVETIKPYVDQFVQLARMLPSKRFLVTRIGCGIAGFTDADIAPLFAEALRLPNVLLPQEFVQVLCAGIGDTFEALVLKLDKERQEIVREMESVKPDSERFGTAASLSDNFRKLQMPESVSLIPLDIKLNKTQMDAILRGHRPDAMEDHWYMCCDRKYGTIDYYRSWTGIHIYSASYYEVPDDPGTFRIIYLKVNRDASQYSNSCDRRDLAQFLALLTMQCGVYSELLSKVAYGV